MVDIICGEGLEFFSDEAPRIVFGGLSGVSHDLLRGDESKQALFAPDCLSLCRDWGVQLIRQHRFMVF